MLTGISTKEETVKLDLTLSEFNYLISLLDKRGDVLMKRTSKQSEYELAQIDYLTFKLSQTEKVAKWTNTK